MSFWWFIPGFNVCFFLESKNQQGFSFAIDLCLIMSLVLTNILDLGFEMLWFPEFSLNLVKYHANLILSYYIMCV